MVTQMAASNAVLQTIVEENKRGRVMSFYTMAFFGMGPLGSLLAGCLASTLGTAATFLIFGMVCVAGSLVFAALLPGLRRAVRPIYIRVGILPDASAEVQTAESCRLVYCWHRAVPTAEHPGQRADPRPDRAPGAVAWLQKATAAIAGVNRRQPHVWQST